MPASLASAERDERPRRHRQLVAYRAALCEPVKCLNLIVNLNEASAPVEHLWSDAELENGWRAFTAAHQLWCIEKNYTPGREPTGEMVLTTRAPTPPS